MSSLEEQQPTPERRPQRASGRDAKRAARAARARADTRARAVYLTQIGYISMQITETLATRMARIPSYVELFTDAAPSPRELARFHARHGFSGASVLAADAAPA